MEKMPTELIKDFIDKECVITLIGENKTEISGKIIAVEGYWIKIEEKDCIKVINGVMVRDIKTLIEK